MKTILVAALLFGFAALADSAADPAIERYAKHLKTSRDFTIKVAEQMPEASYDFKLTPPQMSFAQQLIHIGESNLYFIPVSPEESRPSPNRPWRQRPRSSSSSPNRLTTASESFKKCRPLS